MPIRGLVGQRFSSLVGREEGFVHAKARRRGEGVAPGRLASARPCSMLQLEGRLRSRCDRSCGFLLSAPLRLCATILLPGIAMRLFREEAEGWVRAAARRRRGSVARGRRASAAPLIPLRRTLCKCGRVSCPETVPPPARGGTAIVLQWFRYDQRVVRIALRSARYRPSFFLRVSASPRLRVNQSPLTAAPKPQSPGRAAGRPPQYGCPVRRPSRRRIAGAAG